MAGAKELPQLIGEFFDLAKQYLKDSITLPARRLGRLAGFSFMSAMLFALAALLLGVVVLRVITEAMPDGRIWSGFGYILASLSLLAVTGLVMWRASR